MKNSYTFGPVTIRRADVSERNKLMILCSRSRLERENVPVTPKLYEIFQSKIPYENGSLYPNYAELKNSDLFTYVAETPPHSELYAVFTDEGRQISGLTSNCVADHSGENQWKIGWFFPTQSPYHVAECLLAASILQAKQIEADAVLVDALFEKDNEFFENKGLFYRMPKIDKLVLADYHYDDVLRHLSRETGYNFNL